MKRHCECTNHMGTQKQLFYSKDAALANIVRHHMWTKKSFKVYSCPTTSGFHVSGAGPFKSPRKKNFNV